MQLGRLTLTRRTPSALEAAALVRAYQVAGEPQRSLICLAAFGATVETAGMPARRPEQDYLAHGRDIEGWLTLRGASIAQAVTCGMMAVRSLVTEISITDADVAEYASFFGIPPVSSSDAASQPDTREAPSEG